MLSRRAFLWGTGAAIVAAKLPFATKLLSADGFYLRRLTEISFSTVADAAMPTFMTVGRGNSSRPILSLAAGPGGTLTWSCGLLLGNAIIVGNQDTLKLEAEGGTVESCVICFEEKKTEDADWRGWFSRYEFAQGQEAKIIELIPMTLEAV